MIQRDHILSWARPAAAGLLVLGLGACGDKQQAAKTELSAKAFTFTVEEYMRAAKEGNVSALKHFIEAGMAVDVKDEEGTTALFRASQAGRAEAVRFLLSQNASAETTGTGYDTPLVAAARVGSVDTLRALLDAKADSAARTEKSWTALTAAAYRGELDCVKLLAPVSQGSLDEALQIASLQGKTDVVDALLANGADVFSRSKENKTPLMYAAANGHLDAVRILLLNGSNPLALDGRENTASDLANEGGHKEVAALLNDPRQIEIERKAKLPSHAGELNPPAEEAAALAQAGPAATAGENHPGLVAEGTPAPDATVALHDTAASGQAAEEAPFSHDHEDASGQAMAPTQAALSLARMTAKTPGENHPHRQAGAPATEAEAREAAEAAADLAMAEQPTGEAAAPRPRYDTPAYNISLDDAVAEQSVTPRLQGSTLRSLEDSSAETVRRQVRVKDFRESQLPIVLEDVPAQGESARIRILGQGRRDSQIVPAGGVIGETGLELVKVQRKFLPSKMGAGEMLDVSQAIVRDRATGQRHLVLKNEAARSSQATALISAGPGGEVYEAREGDEFSIGGETPVSYRVLDVRPTQVVVENLDTRETVTLARTYGR